jgi:hypothetical protein
MAKRTDEPLNKGENQLPAELPFSQGDHWTYLLGVLPTDIIPNKDWNTRSHLLVSMNLKLVDEFSKAYLDDLYFKRNLAVDIPQPQKVLTPSHF